VTTVSCTPDDECKGHPKHVEWYCSKIKYWLLIVACRWTLQYRFMMHGTMSKKSGHLSVYIDIYVQWNEQIRIFIPDWINVELLAKYHGNILKISSFHCVLISFTNFHAALVIYFHPTVLEVSTALGFDMLHANALRSPFQCSERLYEESPILRHVSRQIYLQDVVLQCV
jgi:hypothetical protein